MNFALAAAARNTTAAGLGIEHLSASQATAALAIGCTAMALIGVGALLFVVLLYMMSKMQWVEFTQKLFDTRAGAELVASMGLALGWFMLGMSTMTVDGCNVTRVAFNCVAWGWTLGSVAHYFGSSPASKPVSLFYMLAALLSLAALGWSAVVGGHAKYASLPLIVVVALVAVLLMTLLSTDRSRALVYAAPDENKIRVSISTASRAIAAAMLANGVLTLVFELLSNEYTGQIPAGFSLLPMFFSHIALVAQWLFCALSHFFDGQRQLAQQSYVGTVLAADGVSPDGRGQTGLMDDGI